MVSTIAFVALVGAVALQRLLELRRSARNEARLRAAGAVEHAPRQMAWMRLLHASWLVAMPLEVVLLSRPFVPWLAAVAGGVFLVGQALRILAMRALGERWSVRVMTLESRPPEAGGIFRYLRHPNYLGVILEIGALPLVHGAWLTATVFSVANGLLLWRRIRVEERALDTAGEYRDRLGDRPPLWPRIAPRPAPEA